MNLIIAASSGGITDILRETAETFGWNWKLFLSQVISFCIVAYLLQRFAYKPILAVLEERRRTIEQGQLNAEKIKKELAQAETRYQEVLAKANADAQRMIDEARESAAHRVSSAMPEARTNRSHKRSGNGEIGALTINRAGCLWRRARSSAEIASASR